MLEKYICFENKGEMDINSLMLMGCSTKNGVDTIGKFGTGLKYAIAVLMRNDIKFEIFIGKKHIEFDTEGLTVNGKHFDRIMIDGEESGFTTDLGREWEIWQGVREFYANCLDEGGNKLSWRWNRKGKDGNTRIFIRESDISEEMYRFKFDKWIRVNDNLAYLKKDKLSPIKVYKQGFLVYEGYSEGEDSYYDYQINNIKINESRLVEDKWRMQYDIGEVQLGMNGYSINAIIDSEEYNIASFSTGLNEYLNLSEEWIAVLNSFKDEDVKKLPSQIRDAYRRNKSRASKTYSHGASVIYKTKQSAYVIEEKGSVELLRDRTAGIFISGLSDKEKKFEILFDEKLEIHINTLYKKDFELYKNVAIEYLNNNDKEQIEYILELLEEKCKK